MVPSRTSAKYSPQPSAAISSPVVGRSSAAVAMTRM